MNVSLYKGSKSQIATSFKDQTQIPSNVQIKDIFMSSQAMPPKDPLEISFYQKAAFGMNVAGFISSSLGFSGLSTPLHYFGLAFQVFSGVTLIQQAFQSPSIQTATPLTSFALTFTPLAPIIQGISTYTMCSDSLHQAKNLIDKRDGKNDSTIARNLFIYAINAFSSCYHFSRNLPFSSEPSLNTESVHSAKQTLFPTTTPTSINEQTVKEAFRSRSKVLHPDKGGTPEAFTELQNARDTLLKSLNLPSPETWNLFSLAKQVSSAFFRGMESLDRFTRFPGAEGAIVQGSCQDRINEAPQFFEPILEALKTGQYRLEVMTNTNSGVYFVKKPDGATVAIFKPTDEDNEGPQNRDPNKRKPTLSSEDMYFQEEIPGFSSERQALAYELDFGSEACMPMGMHAKIESNLFVDVKAEAKQKPAKKQKKAGYLQEWIPEATPLVQLHPAYIRKQKPKNVLDSFTTAFQTPAKEEDPYEIRSNTFLDEVPLDEFQKIAIMDALLFNTDRHPGNILITRDFQNKPHMVPIDSDRILPGKLKSMRTGLFLHKRAKQPLTAKSLDFIRSLDPDQIAFKVKKAGLPDLAAKNAKALALALKEFGPDFSLAEIFHFIAKSGRLTGLIDRSDRRSLISFSKSEKKDYDTSESLRKKAWKKQPLTQDEKNWQEGYVSRSKEEIEELKEKYFWVYFERGLKRELSIAKMKKTRNIVFGTTYVSGNTQRDALSKLVSDNQQSFAKLWDLEGRVVTDSVLAKKCKDSSGSANVDCVPYWNKIEVLRQWLNEPSSPEGKEEWYILADDDMPVTNMNFNPYEAIDLVRRAKDSSIIIVRDVHLWKNGDPDLSVNTGLLIVRKDAKSKAFMEKLWEKRNDPTRSSNPLCPTLGTCQNQDVLHEQEAFARVLQDDRSLLDKTVTVIKPRDTYKGKEIALNTFNRHGHFTNEKPGWGSSGCFRLEDMDKAYPEGAHREGDAMGQTAGVPIYGRDCDVVGSGPENLREKKLRGMIGKLVYLDNSPLAESETSQIKQAVQQARTFESLLSQIDQTKKTILLQYRSNAQDLMFQGVKVTKLSSLTKTQLERVLKNSDLILSALQEGVRFESFEKINYDIESYRSQILELTSAKVPIKTLWGLPDAQLMSIFLHSNFISSLLKKGILFEKIIELGPIVFDYEQEIEQLQKSGASLKELFSFDLYKLQDILKCSSFLDSLFKKGISWKDLGKIDYNIEAYESSITALQDAGVSSKTLFKLNKDKLQKILKESSFIVSILKDGLRFEDLEKINYNIDFYIDSIKELQQAGVSSQTLFNLTEEQLKSIVDNSTFVLALLEEGLAFEDLRRINYNINRHKGSLLKFLDAGLSLSYLFSLQKELFKTAFKHSSAISELLKQGLNFEELMKLSPETKNLILDKNKAEVIELVKAKVSINTLLSLETNRLKNILQYSRSLCLLLAEGVRFREISSLDYDVRKMILSDYKTEVLSLIKKGVKLSAIAQLSPLEFGEQLACLRK